MNDKLYNAIAEFDRTVMNGRNAITKFLEPLFEALLILCVGVTLGVVVMLLSPFWILGKIISLRSKDHA